MSTIAIVLIVIGVLLLLGLLAFVLSPKRRAEKKLRAEREQAVSHHREVASERHSRASLAEQQAEEARVKAERAEHEARLARQEASVHEGRADLHEQGALDHELDSGPAAGRVPDTAGPEEATTQIDRPDQLSERREDAVQDTNGRYTSSTTTPPPPTGR